MSVVTTTILSNNKPIDTSYELLSIDISKEVNRIPYAQLVLIDGDVTQQTFAISNTDFFEPGQPIEIKLHYEDAPNQKMTVFKGVVVRHKVEADLNESLLTLELKDAAVQLTRTRNSAVHQGTDADIIGNLVAGKNLTKGKMPATKVTHAELVQYYCTDWDFILSRADSLGLLVVANDGELSLAEVTISSQPKHVFEYGISDIYNFEIEVDGGQQYGAVESIAWDIKTQKLTKAATATDFSLMQGNLKGKDIATAIGVKPAILSSPVPLDPKELQAWSDATLIRNRLAFIRGRLSVPGYGDYQLLDALKVAGIGDRFNGQTLVTGIRHRVSQDGWQTDIQFGLPANRFAEQHNIIDAPAAGLLPAVNGLQIGVVAPFEEDPDKEFRVKVILPGIDETEGLIWARLASPEAGLGRGYFFRPEPGDEVIVGFFNNDPRQAVILGAMYSSKNTPPEGLELSADNIQKVIYTKNGTVIGFVDDAKSSVFIRTPDLNMIVLDDDTQTVAITDQHENAITMSKDGIEIKSAKDVIINASGKVEITGQAVDVK